MSREAQASDGKMHVPNYKVNLLLDVEPDFEWIFWEFVETGEIHDVWGITREISINDAWRLKASIYSQDFCHRLL